jgi:hypothetical protein
MRIVGTRWGFASALIVSSTLSIQTSRRRAASFNRPRPCRRGSRSTRLHHFARPWGSTTVSRSLGNWTWVLAGGRSLDQRRANSSRPARTGWSDRFSRGAGCRSRYPSSPLPGSSPVTHRWQHPHVFRASHSVHRGRYLRTKSPDQHIRRWLADVSSIGAWPSRRRRHADRGSGTMSSRPHLGPVPAAPPPRTPR